LLLAKAAGKNGILLHSKGAGAAGEARAVQI